MVLSITVQLVSLSYFISLYFVFFFVFSIEDDVCHQIFVQMFVCFHKSYMHVVIREPALHTVRIKRWSLMGCFYKITFKIIKYTIHNLDKFTFDIVPMFNLHNGAFSGTLRLRLRNLNWYKI